MPFDLEKDLFQPFDRVIDELRHGEAAGRPIPADPPEQDPDVLPIPAPGQAEVINYVRAVLKAASFRFGSEARLHTLLSSVLQSAGVEFTHEKPDGSSRYDFMLQAAVVLEVKVDGSRADALRQADRYCQSPLVSAVLILATPYWARGGESLTLRCKTVEIIPLAQDSF